MRDLRRNTWKRKHVLSQVKREFAKEQKWKIKRIKDWLKRRFAILKREYRETKEEKWNEKLLCPSEIRDEKELKKN
jgi:hypothetical protein